MSRPTYVRESNYGYAFYMPRLLFDSMHLMKHVLCPSGYGDRQVFHSVVRGHIGERPLGRIIPLFADRFRREQGHRRLQPEARAADDLEHGRPNGRDSSRL